MSFLLLIRVRTEECLIPAGSCCPFVCPQLSLLSLFNRLQESFELFLLFLLYLRPLKQQLLIFNLFCFSSHFYCHWYHDNDWKCNTTDPTALSDTYYEAETSLKRFSLSVRSSPSATTASFLRLELLFTQSRLSLLPSTGKSLLFNQNIPSYPTSDCSLYLQQFGF